MGIRVTSAGALSTIQDNGRIGFMDFGFSPSGCMDQESMIIANLLVGNNKNEGVIEITYGGFSGIFTSKSIFTITGADISPAINGKSVSTYKAIEVKEGDILTCGYAKTGLRSYLAFHSGLYLKKVMGSLSTNRMCKIGGYMGRELRAMDLLFFNTTTPTLKKIHKREIVPPVFSSEVVLRGLRGAEYSLFSDDSRRVFFNSEYTVTKDSDRMGIKLDGAVVDSKAGFDIISNGMGLGEVQITASGLPIVMGVDRQTVGGYPKIMTVASSDMHYAAQVRPNDRLCFEELSYDKLVKICNKRRKVIYNLSRLWK
ncbi:MAG: biotin-dependent carboxyltransferase family protein [Christensenellaceae bacterium]|jgi:biotin-dependent carboxylase-like uncharacterized protein|nr:biotin-dependent carboxyltransferase family protein [Christensenellaceae bacterium]